MSLGVKILLTLVSSGLDFMWAQLRESTARLEEEKSFLKIPEGVYR